MGRPVVPAQELAGAGADDQGAATVGAQGLRVEVGGEVDVVGLAVGGPADRVIRIVDDVGGSDGDGTVSAESSGLVAGSAGDQAELGEGRLGERGGGEGGEGEGQDVAGWVEHARIPGVMLTDQSRGGSASAAGQDAEEGLDVGV